MDAEISENMKGLTMVYFGVGGTYEGDLFDAFWKCASHDISERYLFLHTMDTECRPADVTGNTIRVHRRFRPFETPVENEPLVLYEGGANADELIAFAETVYIPKVMNFHPNYLSTIFLK